MTLNRAHIDKPFWVIFLSLLAVSILALFSSSSTIIMKATAAGHSPLRPIALQIALLGVGVVFAYFLQFLPSWVYRVIGYLVFAVGLLFVLLNAFHIGHDVNGAYRWMKFGIFTIQSSELAKLGLVIVVSDLLARIHDEKSQAYYFRIVLVLTAVTCFLIMIGNLSTAILLGAVVIVLMILAKIPWKWWTGIVAVAAIALILMLLIVKFAFVDPGREEALKNTPLERAVTWVHRVWSHGEEKVNAEGTYRLTNDNYQEMMARVAVAHGGQSPFGVGVGNSVQRNHLPLANADYIFSIIVEETGIVGAVLLSILYLSILFRCCYASSRYSDYSSQLMVMGLGILLTLQALISMAVAVGLGPVTGQPLPMMTKGGTSALVTSIYFGIMMGVAREQNEKQALQQQTIEESESNVPDIEVDEVDKL